MPDAAPSGDDGRSCCGLYCGACDLRLAGETGHRTRFARFWTEGTIRASLRARGVALPAGEPIALRCGGCRSGAPFVNCRDCRLRACAVGRGLETCAACADHPCATWREWSRAAALLPHVGDAGANLASIRERGVERWLAEEDARWRCPACGGRIAWYSEACGACGADVRARTFRLSPVKAALLRILLRFARLRAPGPEGG